MAMEKPWLSGATQVHLRLICPQGFVVLTPVCKSPGSKLKAALLCSIDATKKSIRVGFRTPQVLCKVSVLVQHYFNEI